MSKPPAARRGWRCLTWASVGLAGIVLVAGAIAVAFFLWQGGTNGLLDRIAGLIGLSSPAVDEPFDVDASVEATVRAMPAATETPPAPETPADPTTDYATLSMFGRSGQWIPAYTPTLVWWGWTADTEEQLENFLAALTMEIRIGGMGVGNPNQYWSEPQEDRDYDGDGDMDYMVRWEYLRDEGYCDRVYPASAKMTLDRPVSDGEDTFSGEFVNIEFEFTVGEPPTPTPMHFTVVNDLTPVGEPIFQVVLTSWTCSYFEDVLPTMEGIEIHNGSEHELDTMLPPGMYTLLFNTGSGPLYMEDVMITEGARLYINESTTTNPW